MSGIFGFSRLNGDQATLCKSIHALEVWNRSYGSAAEETMTESNFGIGCHVEHFSDTFSFGKPILNMNGSVAVIDALLYNRDELFGLFNDAKINTHISDEELLLRLISEKGYESLAQINGDFAGAIYDPVKQKWTLFRDHMGVRPLYYYIDENQFAFSTDIRGLLALPDADTSPDDGAVYYRMMGYNDLTLCGTDYAKIHCIHPASWTEIQVNENGFDQNEHIYWKLKQKKIRLKNNETYFMELRRLITAAVKRRLDAIPGIIGAELSGGLDSGVIDILICRLNREGRFFSWSWATDDLPLQEGDDERKVIFDICNQENITCKFTPKEQTKSTETYLAEVMPPFVNTLNLSDGSAWLKSEGANVVFTGHGGDEGVSHRCPPFELLYNGEFLSYFKHYWHSTKGKKLRLLRTLKRGIVQGIQDYSEYTAPYHNTGLISANYLSKDFKEKMQSKQNLQTLYFSYAPARYVEQGGTRIRLDNAAYQGAKNGVRYMIPFVDYRVIDFAVSIPRRMYLQKGHNRYIYREAFKDIIPESLYHMRYKDTASLRGYKIDTDLYESFYKSLTKISGMLDRDFWKDYLDFAAIDTITLPENITRNEYNRYVWVLHELNRCLMVQNAKEKAGKWCDEHE